MGYTHYFNFKPETNQNPEHTRKFKETADLIKKVFCLLPREVEWDGKMLPLKLFGPLGTGEPIITDSRISFNGDKSNKLNHDTFLIPRDYDTWSGDICWTFCKTARKPYDIAVCLAILCFKQVYGEDFKFHSDGDMRTEEGWRTAKQILKHYNKQNREPR